ncbi:hypothetical protein QBC47DRAFT_425021 [Echria macrotheca]|uniref:NDT80 domain-containing protein n=1 Tax=Echria macrotheca TaxID=438768 RepID=A0AAJ0F3D2_9PEZI|nr:hypothetical protein QBC47DRAFT_425021 [Echria macrotheca]
MVFLTSYTQESASSLSTLEASAQPSTFLNLIPPPVTPYSPEGGHFYSAAPTLFPGLDVRPRLGSNSTSGPGMAQAAPRSTTLPHPGSQLSTRDIYSSATPSYRRQPDHHLPRSPSFPAIRRHPLTSPTPSPVTYNSLRMDGSVYGSKAPQNIPPLNSMVSLGHLSYQDPGQTPIKVDISGIIDKGFFLADNEWTCYRRNYFSCVCSYSITPPPHGYTNVGMHFLRSGDQQPFQVYGFAMCISAVVADNDNLSIELVQHTPKRDKGPIAKPEKVRLAPKPPQTSHHPISNMYNGPSGEMASSRAYDQGFGTQSNLTNEHTFERIQFKQATANNGKRRAAQQYYHLIVELWADVGSQHADQFVKVAYKKSAKMIVRGRSPGHYQSERRASTSSGPGGSAGGSIAGAGYASGVMGSGDYSSTQSMMQGGYGTTYDPRGYGGTRHHQELSMEPIISAEECKAITEPKAYQYYAAPIYEGEQDPRQHQVELFSHGRSESENSAAATMSSGFDPTKVKPETDSGLPSLYYTGTSFYSQRCGRFEGKPSSAGYYPTAIPPTSTMSMT